MSSGCQNALGKKLGSGHTASQDKMVSCFPQWQCGGSVRERSEVMASPLRWARTPSRLNTEDLRLVTHERYLLQLVHMRGNVRERSDAKAGPASLGSHPSRLKSEDL
eukprot:7057162-Prymnesium_polylepis.1